MLTFESICALMYQNRNLTLKNQSVDLNVFFTGFFSLFFFSFFVLMCIQQKLNKLIQDRKLNTNIQNIQLQQEDTILTSPKSNMK